MPYLEGESLRDRLDRERQLPVDEAVRIATDVAGALDFAHARGVIHRDIKPANILLQAGKPVISDFGIALALSSVRDGRLTETGLSLGTPHYMSPEQAAGDQSVGPATDIWALGCVLYEMLVGEPPYTGSIPQAVLAKIMTSEPPSAAETRKSVPPFIDATIRKALEKVPADRFATAADFAAALADGDFQHGTKARVRAGRSAQGPWNRLSIGLATMAGLLAIGLVWSAASEPPSEPRPIARFDVTPPADQTLPLVPGVNFDISADGSRIVFVGAGPGPGVTTQLWQRLVEELEAVPIPGTEGALGPVLSPDGSAVAYQADGQVWIVGFGGGPPVDLARGINPAWGADDTIYYLVDNTIHRVAATGGEGTPVTAPVEGYVQRYPDALPNGRGLLVTLTVMGPFPAESRIAVVGPDGGEVRELLAGTMARYTSSGHIVYTTAAGSLMAAPFDLRRLEITGAPVAVVEGVMVKGGSASVFALSESGALLYGTSVGQVSELVWVSRSGEVERFDATWTGVFENPALSPDGSRLAVSMRSDGETHVWVRALDGGGPLKLTLDGTLNRNSTWTPDGSAVTYQSDQAGVSLDIWTRRADGSAPAELELDDDRAVVAPDWSPNGEWLVARTGNDDVGMGDILAFRPREQTPPTSLIATGSRELAPVLSPNGRWMAYASNESERYEIYVVPFPNTADGRWVVSAAGGIEPLWSRGGDELFYRNEAGDMVAVRVDTEPTFSPGVATPLFSASAFRTNVNHREYDVAPGGDRFIMLRPTGEDQESEWILVLNFLDQLRAAVPVP
jgi:serine/threonine-protein kinase